MIVGFEKSVPGISRLEYTVILPGTASLSTSFFFRMNICVRRLLPKVDRRFNNFERKCDFI